MATSEQDAIAYAREYHPPDDEWVKEQWRVRGPTPPTNWPIVSGPCHRCNHPCQSDIENLVVHGGGPAAVDASIVAEQTRLVICNCNRTHPGRPEGVHGGCGRYWLARVTRHTDTEASRYQVTVETDLGLLPAAEAFAELLASQDKRIQAAAEKWLGGLAAVYGLFSLTGAAAAKDGLTDLDTGWRWLIGATFVLGLATAGVALMLGYTAAYGWPKTDVVDDNAKLKKWYADYRNYSKQAADHLKRAIIFACVSLTLVSTVTLLIWVLPRSTTA